jgi:hypothetical protein
MRLIKLIVPAALVAALSLIAPYARAQTMGEYATATAGVASGGGSIGAIAPASIGTDDLGGGARTWGASSLGGSFEDRAGAVSSTGAGADFESRAGSMGAGSTSESRWPGSRFGGGNASARFSDSSGDSSRWSSADRFKERSELSSSERFPASRFNDNRTGLDTNFQTSGLDASHSSNGLDSSYNSH